MNKYHPNRHHRLQSLTFLLMMPLFVFPASSNYQLNEWSFGSGGTDNIESSNYGIHSILGGRGDNQEASSNYMIGPGLEYVIMANVPPAPTWVNDSNYYNKLEITIDQGDNPSDATYAIAISDDDFATTNYVQSDNTVGATLGPEDWQSYADWGGASGEFVVGLESDTTYKVKVKAEQGDFTESPWGPTASAATAAVSMDFDIDISSTDSETAGPYILAIGDLSIGSVTTATDKLWVDFGTNGEGGGYVYVYGTNYGLNSASQVHTINSISADLSGQTEGYGLRVDTVTESSGGPFAAVAPYNGAGDNVGIVDDTIRSIYSSANPITAGRGSTLVKVKTSAYTPAADDYTETVTVIASATF